MRKTGHLWSISAIATELERNPRTIARALNGVPRDGTIKGGHDAWHLGTAVSALMQYERQSDQLSERHHNGTSSGGNRPSCSEADIVAGERANEAVAALLDALHRESDIEKRRALFQRDGHCIGDLHRGIEILLDGDPLRALHEPVLRQAVRSAIGTALDLCSYELEKPGDGKAAAG